MARATARRKSKRVPSYRHHKPSGQGVVTLNGKDHYCGKWGEPASERRYREMLAAWIANDRRPLALNRGLGQSDEDCDSLSIAELAVHFFAWADEHYRKHGQATSQPRLLRRAITPVIDQFTALSVNDFGPNALRSIRQLFIDRQYARHTINGFTGKIRLMFKWGVARELVKPEVLVALSAIEPVKAGRGIGDRPPTKPMPDDAFEQILPFLRPWTRAAVIVQRRTGMRAGEMLMMRPCDIDATGEIWWYVPQSHKTEHHGKERRVPIGPLAQEALRPLLDDTPPTGYVFRKRRGPGKGTVLHPKRYAVQFHRACKLAKVDYYRPHSLRHSRLTEIRKSVGLDAAQAVGGHATVNVTLRYAKVSDSHAIAAAKAGG